MLWIAIPGAYTLLSLLTYLALWRDKRAASRGRQRTSEATLHLMELLGGWPGTLLAQRRLRHKNRKLSYRLTVWLIAILHLAGWSAAAWWMLRGM